MSDKVYVLRAFTLAILFVGGVLGLVFLVDSHTKSSWNEADINRAACLSAIEKDLSTPYFRITWTHKEDCKVITKEGTQILTY